MVEVINDAVLEEDDCTRQMDFDCAVGCSHCPVSEAGSEQKEGGMQGWSFAGAAAGYFLVPLVLAFAGAAFGGESQVNQFVGATVGFGAGMGGAMALTRRGRIDEEAAW
ncbi:MAG: hypothetical protein HOC74_06060 [Gemmatimonadetes bacterium]|jgi:hypothetical protein|nr:hypothetical protein [Gemmatimonadota bacterium]